MNEKFSLSRSRRPIITIILVTMFFLFTIYFINSTIMVNADYDDSYMVYGYVTYNNSLPIPNGINITFTNTNNSNTHTIQTQTNAGTNITGSYRLEDTRAINGTENGHAINISVTYAGNTGYQTFTNGDSDMGFERVDITISGNLPPALPSAPTGQVIIFRGQSYNFSASTTDPDGDNISYMFDWGDGNLSNWTNTASSGSSVNSSHRWNSSGIFEIKVKAKDEHGAERGYNASSSDWSESLTTTVYTSVDAAGQGDYTSIQNAIDNASNGDIIYVCNGTYSENILINKSITLLGETKSNTTITYNQGGNIVDITAPDVNISNFTINVNNWGIGIKLEQNATNCTISNTIILNANYALKIESVNNNNITSNILQNNEYGIILSSSNSTTIANNIIRNNTGYRGYGISLDSSSQNNISGNIIKNCTGTYAYGLYLSSNSNSNTIENNTIQNHTYHGIYLLNVNNNTIVENTIQYNTKDGIHLSSSNNCSITNNTIKQNLDDAISLSDSNHTRINNNNVWNNTYGIGIHASTNNTIVENAFVNNGLSVTGNNLTHYNHNITTSNTINGKTLHYYTNQNNLTIQTEAGQIFLINCTNTHINNITINNTETAIKIAYSQQITVTNCTIHNNSDGLSLSYSTNITVSENEFINDGLSVTGNNLTHYNHNITTSNTINGKTLHYYTNQNNLTIQTEAGQIFLINCTNTHINNITINNTETAIKIAYSQQITVTNCTIHNNSNTGINLDSSNNNTILDNTLQNNNYGIYTSSSNNDTISSNTIHDNTYDGIKLSSSNDTRINRNTIQNNSDDGIEISSSHRNTIQGNTINNNTEGAGLYLYSSENNTIAESNTVDNNVYGILLSSSNNNTIMENHLANNSDYGLRLYSANTNLITGNTLQNNNYGIYLSHPDYGPSDNNTIFRNNFISNTNQAYDVCNNIWHNTTLQHGNYWSNFDEAAEDAYDNNSNGVIDTPYNITGSNNQDQYPLSTQWSNQQPNKPSSPSPSNGATGQSKTITISWTGNDPNNDTLTYDIYFGTTNPPLKIVSNQSSNTYSPGTLSSSTTYYWKITAWDLYLEHNTSNTWSFTTSTPSSSSPSPTIVNNAPNSFSIITTPNPSVTGQTITVSGTTTDPDGDTVNYTYEWDDNSADTTENTHSYTQAGTYTITCTATDGNGGTQTTSTTHIVTTPPSKTTSNTTQQQIQEQYNLSLEKPFYANDTDEDGIVDAFIDPNQKLHAINTTNINGNTSFLISTNNDDLPEFFWDTESDTITPVKSQTAKKTGITTDQHNETITMKITVEKANWTYIETNDTYPNQEIIVKTQNGRIIPTNKTWRKNGKIYILDDPTTEYHLIYSYQFLQPTITPSDGSQLTISKPTITINYNENVTILESTLNDQTINLTSTDNTSFTFTPDANLPDGEYTIEVSAQDTTNNVRTDAATFTISAKSTETTLPLTYIYGVITALIAGIIIVFFIFFRKRK